MLGFDLIRATIFFLDADDIFDVTSNGYIYHHDDKGPIIVNRCSFEDTYEDCVDIYEDLEKSYTLKDNIVCNLLFDLCKKALPFKYVNQSMNVSVDITTYGNVFHVVVHTHDASCQFVVDAENSRVFCRLSEYTKLGSILNTILKLALEG